MSDDIGSASGDNWPSAVVDLWGGAQVPADETWGEVPWAENALADLTSATKVMASTSLLLQVERGAVRLE